MALLLAYGIPRFQRPICCPEAFQGCVDATLQQQYGEWTSRKDYDEDEDPEPGEHPEEKT
jgi:hypothetical protein